MKVKLIAIPLLLCCAQMARGQCSNGPCYTANPPGVTRLTPAQYAAQGDGHTNAAVTLNVSAISGKQASHTMEVGVGSDGSILGLNWKSWNVASLDLYYALDSGPWELWSHLGSQNGFNGSYPFPFPIPASWANHTLYMGLVGTTSAGATTQDIVTMPITNQAPGIYSNDLVPSNYIIHFHASGGGGSMLNDFTMCQGADQQHCINATHTPFTWLTIANLTQGTSVTHSKHQSGNIAKANEAVSFGDDVFLPALPEDIFDYSEGDEVDCSVSGPVGVGPVQMDIRFERAITEEYISSILNSNGMHPEHIYCIIAATPPDFPGADEALPGTPSGQVVNIAFLYREWPIGTQEKGTPWNLVFPDIQEVGIGYYVKTTMEPDPVGCTMWDNGFRHLPLPTPLDPQPQ